MGKCIIISNETFECHPQFLEYEFDTERDEKT